MKYYQDFHPLDRIVFEFLQVVEHESSWSVYFFLPQMFHGLYLEFLSAN